MNSAILKTTASPPSAERLRIGELAALTSVSVEALRYYEARGLISPSTRRASGYREFTRHTVQQVHFIGRAQSLGFSLAEVKELVHLRQRAWGGDATSQLRSAVMSKMKGLDDRLRQLRSLRRELAGMLEACDTACDVSPVTARGNGSVGGKSESIECPLVDALENHEKPTRRKPKAKSAVVGPSPGRRAGRQRRLVPESVGSFTSQRRTRR
jgi:MerR family Zn(II)-responsive transcriptional regulator of zntA